LLFHLLILPFSHLILIPTNQLNATRQVVDRAAEDLKLELLRLRPVLLPLERAKQRLRIVLEALDQRNNGNNATAGAAPSGGNHPSQGVGSAGMSLAAPSTPPPPLPRAEVPLPPSPAVLDALKVCVHLHYFCRSCYFEREDFPCVHEKERVGVD